jgi:ribosomal protein S18 acetylase RimI-like enzyme
MAFEAADRPKHDGRRHRRDPAGSRGADERADRIVRLATGSAIAYAIATSLVLVFIFATELLTSRRYPLRDVAAAAAELPLLIGLVFIAARGTRTRASWWLAAMAVLVYAPLPWLTYNWLATQELLMASALMVLRGRVAVAVAAAPALGTATTIPIYGALKYQTGIYVLWDCGYWLLILTTLAAVLYGAAWLVRTADDLQSARTELAELAIGRERLRVSRDLHDLLGQSLSAVSLKGDLAMRLLTDDRDLTRMSPAQAAGHHYQEELAQYKSPREWWRIAALPGGEPVGFVIPAHNGYDPIIAYIGVRPGYRGRGYVNELLAEGTRILAAEGVPLIRASTDLGNVPMASAFLRAGWADFGHEINMTWA